MATLYVENIPEDLYESLRERARANRRSISAETIFPLERALPTAAELRRRSASVAAKCFYASRSR